MRVKQILSSCSAALWLAGCGYHWGYTRPEGVKTVSVKIFGNDTYRRGVEFALTEELGEEIVNRTGLLLESPEKADAIVKGKIESIFDQTLHEGSNQEAREAATWIVVNAELVDRRSGKVLSTVRIQDKGEFLNDTGENRSTASKQAVSRLAERIVLALCFKTESKNP